ncbi:eCIS core domain-containing protein [Variovorax jilinensis]|uniref:eCIS core domain-containing protein n=1 Tax=Variovorax jilinensis TaxID=3053513 RepID=UPI00257737D3|nr:DUF4157 domain-containing protein [Variovorax sp. J22P168]
MSTAPARHDNAAANPGVRKAATRTGSGVQRFLQVPLGREADAREREADAHAARAGLAPLALGQGAPPAVAASSAPSSIAEQAGSTGAALDGRTRAAMEARLGADFGAVRTHTGPQAALLARDIGADAFTHGHDVFFGAGHAPADDALTTHELSHVVQQSGGGPGLGAAPNAIQRSRNGSFAVANGGFEIDLQTREGAVDTPPTASGLDGYIRFVPGEDAPLSNQIEMVQIVKLTDLTGADVAPATMPADRAARGALGKPGILTEDNAAAGVEGGFFTDVHHQGNVGAPAAPARQGLSTAFPFEPAGPGITGAVGQVAQPDFYGGGIGGVMGHTPGFKRSNDAADIRSAALYDTPGVASTSFNLDFEFESVAMAQDKGIELGAVHWGFGLRAGRVTDEHLSVADTASATFGETLERHRDFYVHEPVSFYFDFDSDLLAAGEAARIDDFMPYLQRHGDVTVSLEGFADQVGGRGAYNAALSMRRVDAVQAALMARGLAAGRFDAISLGHGASTAATADAGTGDQGGDAALGADQSREANRWANRRVVVSFSRPATAPAAGP